MSNFRRCVFAESRDENLKYFRKGGNTGALEAPVEITQPFCQLFCIVLCTIFHTAGNGPKQMGPIWRQNWPHRSLNFKLWIFLVLGAGGHKAAKSSPRTNQTFCHFVRRSWGP